MEFDAKGAVRVVRDDHSSPPLAALGDGYALLVQRRHGDLYILTTYVFNTGTIMTTGGRGAPAGKSSVFLNAPRRPSEERQLLTLPRFTTHLGEQADIVSGFTTH